LTISAKTFTALSELSNNYINILEEMEDENKNVRDLCYTSNIGREHFNDYRISVYGKNATELCNELENALDDYEEKMENEAEQKRHENSSQKPTQLINIYIENLKNSAINNPLFNQLLLELYITRPEFKNAMNYCDNIISEITNKQYSLVSDILSHQENDKDKKDDSLKYQNMILASFYYGLAKTLTKEMDDTTPINVGVGLLGELISIVVNGGMSLRKLMKLLKLIQDQNENETTIKEWYQLKDKKEQKLKGNVYSVSQQREFKSGEVIPEEYYITLLQNKAITINEEALDKSMESIMDQYAKKCKSISVFNEDLSKDDEMKEKLLEIIQEKEYDQLSEDYIISFFNMNDKKCKDQQQCVKKILPKYLSSMYNIGHDIHWNVFHQRINNNNLQKYSVHKIILPNYPFQRSTYWPKN